MAKQNSIAGFVGDTYSSRRAHDTYPTPPEATKALMLYLNLPKETIIREPCSGDGAMSRVMELMGYRVDSSDIRIEGIYGAGGVDYLASIGPNYDAIITNPPFDKSEQIIEKALTEAPIVAVLLKSQYWHAKRRTELFRRHLPSHVLALNWRPDFVGKPNAAPTMEVLWTVWMPNTLFCKYDILERP